MTSSNGKGIYFAFVFSLLEILKHPFFWNVSNELLNYGTLNLYTQSSNLVANAQECKLSMEAEGDILHFFQLCWCNIAFTNMHFRQ